MHFSYLVKLIRVSNDVVDVGEAPIVPGLASCEASPLRLFDEDSGDPNLQCQKLSGTSEEIGTAVASAIRSLRIMFTSGTSEEIGTAVASSAIRSLRMMFTSA